MAGGGGEGGGGAVGWRVYTSPALTPPESSGALLLLNQFITSRSTFVIKTETEITGGGERRGLYIYIYT